MNTCIAMEENVTKHKEENTAFLHQGAENVSAQEIVHNKQYVGRLISCFTKFHTERRWRVLAATVVCQLVAAWPFAFGVFYHELLSVYKERQDIASFVLSVPMGLSFVSGIFVGPLIARFGSRVVVVSGSLIIAISFVLGFFADSILYLILTIGVCGGIGACVVNLGSNVAIGDHFDFRYQSMQKFFSYLGSSFSGSNLSAISSCSLLCFLGIGACMVNLGSNVAIGDHFDKGKDMAYSIGGIGTSFGTLVVMPMHAYVIPRYGLHGGLLITCALLLHALPAGLVLSPRRSRRHLDIKQEDNRIQESNTPNMKVKCKELFTNPVFVLWLCVCVLGSMTSIMFYIVFVDFVVSEGVSETSGALMATLPGITGILGRICFGLLSRKIKDVRKVFLSLSALALCGTLLIVIAYVHSEAAFYVVACVYGFTMAAVVVALITTTDYLTKGEHRAEAFGLMATATGVGFIASGPFTGRILDATGSYASAFIWNGSLNMATCAVAAVIVMIINLTQRRHHHVV